MEHHGVGSQVDPLIGPLNCRTTAAKRRLISRLRLGPLVGRGPDGAKGRVSVRRGQVLIIHVVVIDPVCESSEVALRHLLI